MLLHHNKSASLTLTLLSSFLLFAAAPGTWSVPLLAWISLAPFFWTLNNQTPRQAAKTGFLCGFCYHLLLLYWIIIALGRYGNLPLWISVPSLIGLAAYMATYFSCFGLLLSWLCKKTPIPAIWLAPIIWVSLDFIRSRMFTGFGWQDLGYSQYTFTRIIQVSDLAGHYGITFLIVIANILLVNIFQKSTSRLGNRQHPSRMRVFWEKALPFFLIFASIFYGFERYKQVNSTISNSPAITVGVIQGNIDQNEKWQNESQEKTVTTYMELSRQAAENKDVGLLVWPETALPFFPIEHPLFQQILAWVNQSERPALLTGAPHYINTPETGVSYYNSAFLVSAAAQKLTIERYDKNHLVPFGEYVPFQKYLPEALPIVQTMGNFSPGKDAKLLKIQQAKMGILICYESIFPDISRSRIRAGANLLINLTNDAWYGKSSAPFQQLSMVTLRAAENKRSLARSANTGISCIIDPLGRIIKESPLFEKYFITEKIPLYTKDTFFTRHGYLFPQLCMLLLSLAILYGMFGKNRQEGFGTKG